MEENQVRVEGRISAHAREVRQMDPTSAQLDAKSFTCDVTSGGVISQPDSFTVPLGFRAELAEIRGMMQSPGTDPELASVILFNIKSDQFKGDIFSSEIEMAHLVDTAGGGQPMDFPNGMYVFAPGSDIKVKFSIDDDATLGYANLASAAKKWGILLRFNLFAV